MNSVSSEVIFRKFEILPENAKREVADFIDFLGQKKKAKKKKIDKRKLLEVSCWDDEAIKAIEEAGEEINKWKPETF
jgi:BioD-like phosphotransacetylase family protein